MAAFNAIAGSITLANAATGIVGNRADRIFTSVLGLTIDNFFNKINASGSDLLLRSIRKVYIESVNYLIETLDTQSQSASDRGLFEKIASVLRDGQSDANSVALTPDGLAMLTDERAALDQKNSFKGASADKLISYIEDSCGQNLPSHFRLLFTDQAPNGRHSWLTAFDRCLQKEISSNAPFARLIISNNLNSVLDHTVIIEDIVRDTAIDVEEVKSGVAEITEYVRGKRRDNGPTTADIMAAIKQLGITNQADDFGISETAIRLIVEDLGGRGVPKDDLASWIRDWIARAKHKLAQKSNVDAEFDAARSEAEQRFRSGAGGSVSEPFMKLLQAEEEESDRKKILLLEEAVKFDILVLDIKAATEKTSLLARLNGAISNLELGEYFENKAMEYHRIGEVQGDRIALLMSLSVADLALQQYTNAFPPVDWVRAQINRTNIILSLGARDSTATWILRAIETAQAVLRVCPREIAPVEWAFAQNNLAKALLRFSERQFGTRNLEEAAFRLQGAAETFLMTGRSYDWAHVQMILGLVCHRLGERTGRTENYDESIASFERALSIYNPTEFPTERARVQMNLALPLLSLAEDHQDIDLIERAIDACNSALKERTQGRVPMEWAMTQNTLGNALSELAKYRNRVENLKSAVNTLRNSLDVYTRDRSQIDWAHTKLNIAANLVRLADQEDGTELLQEALAEVEQALHEVTEVDSPFNWAQAQRKLGQILFELGERETESSYYERAGAAYKQALTKIAKSDNILAWANLQIDFSLTLLRLGECKGIVSYFKESVSLIEATLQELDKDRFSKVWGRAQSYLSTAFFRLGANDGGTDYLWRATEAARETLQVIRREDDPIKWACAQESLAMALAVYGSRKDDAKTLEQAEAAFMLALEEITEGNDRRNWARIQANLAHLLSGMGDSETSAAYLDRAATANMAPLSVHAPQRSPSDWAISRINQGNILFRLSQFDKPEDIERLSEAIAFYREALTLLSPSYIPLEWLRANFGLVRALANLADRTDDVSLLPECVRTLFESETLQKSITNPELQSFGESVREYVEELIKISGFRAGG